MNRKFISLCLLFVLVFSFLTFPEVESAWYNSGWSKRAPVTITNSGSELTNYQVKVSVTYDSDMQADFDDIRFTSSDGTTLIDYWRESYTASTSAIFWVEVPTITASDDTTIYMYYGNASASTTSKGDDTFTFFDDFALTIDETYLTSWTKSGENPLQDKTCQNWMIALYSNYNSEDKIYLYEQRDAHPSTTISCSSFSRSDAANATNWTDHGTIYTASQSWEDGHIEPHGIIFETQAMSDAREGVSAGEGTRKWRMYYCAKGDGEGSEKYDIGFATASESNATSWTAYASNPIYSNDATYGYADSKVSIYNDEVWMALGAYTSTTSSDPIFFTVSSDGIANWTDKTRNWKPEKAGLIGTHIPFSDGILINGRNAANTEYNAYFTPDGDNKATYSSNPILSGGGSGVWDEKFAWNTIVVDKEGSPDLADAGTYYMYYIGYTGATYKLGLATSSTETEESEVSTVLDPSKWTSAGAGSYSISSGEITLTDVKYITSVNTYTGGYAVGVRKKVGTDATGIIWTGFVSTAGVTASINITIAYRRRDTDTYFTAISGDETNKLMYDYVVVIDSAYHIAEARRTGSADRFQFDSGSEITGDYPTNAARYIEMHAYSADIVAEWIYLRKYTTTTEPTNSVGSEEDYNTTPVNNSLTFENPYTSNQAVGDNDGTYTHARYWHFQAKVTDDDGATDLKTVDLKLETSNGADDIVLRWTQATNTFSEVTDTNNWIADLTVNSSSGVVGNQTTLDFKFKISNSFTTMSTDYDMKLLSTDDADATDTDNYANIYEVVPITLGVTLSEETLAYGSADVGTTTASQNVTITNSSNIYVKASIKFSTFTDTESNTMNVYTGDEPRCYFKFNEDNGASWNDIQSWNTYYEHKDDLNFAGGSNTILLYITYTHPLSGHSKNQYTSTLTVGVAIT